MSLLNYFPCTLCFPSILCNSVLHTPSYFSSILFRSRSPMEGLGLLGILAYFLICRLKFVMLLIACFHPHLTSFSPQQALTDSMLIMHLFHSKKYSNKHPTGFGLSSDLYITGSFVFNKMSNDGMYMYSWILY